MAAEASHSREAAKRLAEALRHGLLGIVIDTRLEDVSVVEEGLRQLNLLGLIERWNRGRIVVFYINTRKLRSACLYEECGGRPKHEATPCVLECIQRKIAEIREKLDSLAGAG